MVSNMNKPANELVIFTGNSSANPVGLVCDGVTIWATQEQIAQAFDVDRTVISRHIKNIYAEGELSETTTRAKFARLVDNGTTQQVQYYNLDVVISVGYRVNAKKGTKFRQWATRELSARILGNNLIAPSKDEQRVMIADRVAVENNDLVTAGRELGVIDDAAFLNAGYQGMYKNKMPEIKKIKGLGSDRLLDRAGVTELAANEFRITQTHDKLRKLKEEDGLLVGHGVALTVHHDVGRTVRDAIKEIDGTMPEKLPIEPDHISEVRKRVLTDRVKPKLDASEQG